MTKETREAADKLWELVKENPYVSGTGWTGERLAVYVRDYYSSYHDAVRAQPFVIPTKVNGVSVVRVANHIPGEVRGCRIAELQWKGQ
jgi:hypothetical protein